MKAYRYERQPENSQFGSTDPLKVASSCIYIPGQNIVLVQIGGPQVFLNPDKCFNREGVELSAIFGGAQRQEIGLIESVALVRQYEYPESLVKIKHLSDAGEVSLYNISEFEMRSKDLEEIVMKMQLIKTKRSEIVAATFYAFEKFRGEFDKKDDSVHKVKIKV